MPQVLKIEIRPFGAVAIEIYPAVVNDELRVFAIVKDNPFLPIVNASTHHARELAHALLDAADRAERAHEKLVAPTGKAEAQRAAGLRTQAKPGEPGFQDPKK